MNRVGRGILLYAMGQWSGMALGGTQLPVPCVPGSCGANTRFVTSGAATAVQTGKTLSVQQTSNNATLNWSSFNIGADGKVVFQQPSSAAIALNRIYDANPSSIFGALTANGQVFLVNANGFLFGATSRVNVAGIIASSLNVSDSTFSSGILSPVSSSHAALQQFIGSPQQFADGGTTPGTPYYQATPLTNTGSITVQNGAQLTAADGGRLLLAAPTVQNAGALTAPDGQIILAAGQNVYLQASNDTSLRGLIVQVDGGTAAAGQLTQAMNSQGVTNQATGNLSAARGNITLAGLMVNQNGRISATTSVSANGSVTLEAADTPDFSKTQIAAKRGGDLTIGPDSIIDVLPDYSDPSTAVDLQPQLPSTINLIGEQVVMQGGSIHAPSGTLNVTAVADPSSGLESGDVPQAHLRIDAGTSIDLSGSDAILPVAANLVTVQLRSNELADDPTQRNGALRGKTVTVDVRADGGAGTPIADVSSAIAAVGRTIAQRTEAGGTATFLSEGDVVFSPGASINVSGGATTYLGGNIQTTSLVGANGKLYDIGSANPLLTYTGVVNPTLTQTYDKWGVQEVVPTPGVSHYEAGYQQGAAAGSVQFAAPALSLDGSLAATAVYGPYQRSSGASLGGTLTIGLTLKPAGDASGRVFAPVNATNQIDYVAPPIVISSNPTPLVVADTAALPPQTLQLPATYLTSDGFTNLQINSNTTVELPANLPLHLPAGTSLAVQASRVDVDSSITDLGGGLTFQSELTVAATNPLAIPSLGLGAPRLGVSVGDGVTLDVSGQWTNDSVLAGGVGSAPTAQNGGRIDLQLTQPGSELVLGNDVSLKADGGAWQQSGGALAYGSGGAITLDASPAYAALQFGQTPAIEAFGAGTAIGGSFALSAPRIAISQGSGTAWTTAQSVDELDSPGETVDLYAPLFSNYGFSSIALTATGAVQPHAGSDELTVLGATADSAGTTLLAQTQTLQLSPGYQTQRSGGTLAGFSHPVVLPDYLRPATNVTFNVLREADDVLLATAGYGAIDVQPGASILADPGASIAFNGEGNITLGGTLKAPGGSVSVQLLSPFAYDFNNAPAVDPGYLANLGISIAPSAVIDVSGGAVLTPNNQHLLLGTLRGGGTVDLNAERGTVTLAPGSMIDFSGSSALLDVPNSSRVGGYTAEVVASAGGSLTLSSVESIQMLGTLNGRAGVGSGGAAAAGSLEIDLARAGLQIPGQPDPLGGPLQIELVGSTQGSTATPTVNLASIGVAQIESSGIDSLTLNAGGLSPGLISIDTALPLSLNRSIVFETESLGVGYGIAASLTAPYVEIGNPVIATGTTAPAPSAGTGTLAVTAGQLTLLGGLSLQGVSNATFLSRGDVQLQGSVSVAGPDQGTLSTAGNLTIDALRVYPDTFTDFTIQAQNPGSVPTSVNIDQYSVNGKAIASPGTPLSAGGEINISAGNIEVGGNLLAPFGQIALTASQSLTLSSGSVVSVSGAGLDVPYGQTQLGATQWIYDVTGQGNTSISGTPTKQVSLAAPNLTVQSNATVNLQGGGDLYAYEWVPGTGGSSDSLAGSGTSRIAGLYAILPTAPGQAAPYDPQESAGFGAAQTVYLSGGAGIAPGYYALLPPRYALEPGAVLVQAEPTYLSNSGGQIGSLANGTPVVAGYMSSGTTGVHLGLTEYEGFAVYPADYGQQLATYTISNASTFFGAAAALAGTGPVAEPADAGTLTFTVTSPANQAAASQQVASAATANTLDLEGTVLTAAASGGRGALVNIGAPNLIVNSSGVTAEPNFVAVSAGVLQGWEPSALTLGGVTATAAAPSAGTGSSGNTSLTAATTVSADTLIVDSGVNLSADQLFLVAQQSIDVKPGASLSSTSGKNGTALSAAPPIETLTLVNASGQSEPSAAFLGVSDLVTPVVARSGSGTSGAISLEAGSTLSTGGALSVDAPASVVLDGTLQGKGASWSLGSNSIAFVGSGRSSTSDTFDITRGVLAALQTAGAVRLSSQGSIDLLTPVTLGATSSNATPTLASLTILGTEIDNQAAGDSVFGAASMALGGVSVAGSTPVIPMTGSGKLSLVADALNLVGNSSVAPVTVSNPNPTPVPTSIAIGGFDGTLVQVAGAVTSTGVGGLAVAGDLTINAAQITPGPGTSTTIANSGLLTLGTASAHAGSTALVGGSLTLTANAIVDNGVIAAPSGLVTLNATEGGLELGSAGTITVAGTTLQAVNQSAASPGGMISLNATGDVSLDSGSNISVAGKTVGSLAAPAGSLGIVGGGTVTLAGTLNGNAGTGGVGGSFSLDAGALSGGLTPLASSLMSGANGGFGNAVNIRARGGDLVLAGGASLDANNITLTADTGTVGIAGQLVATSAAQRGSIDLSGTSVALLDSGQLHADGLGAAGLGGEIEINATCPACSISLSPGSIITTAGTAQMGRLVLRAPALTAINDVAINLPSTGIAGIGTDVSRVGQVIIDPITIFQTSNATIGADLPNDVAAVSQYLTTAGSTIASRLTSSSATPIAVQAGVELQDTTLANGSPETLTLPSIDLSPWSTGAMAGTPQVINLTVRSAGALRVNGILSDGFITDPTGNSSLIALSTTPSGSFTLVAGADLGSANPLSVVRGSSAGLTLMSSNRPGDGMIDTVGPSVVRTGTGDINLVASGDVTFAQGLGGGAAAYAAGSSPLLMPGTATTSAVYVQPVSYSDGALIQNFGADGGNVRVNAGGNVVGSPVGAMYTKTDGGNYSVTGWQLHQGSAGIPAQYGIDYGNFDWNIGALGGGDVSITAAGNVNDVSAATADSLVSGAYLASLTGSATTGNPVAYGSGGGLSITANGDIGSTQVFVASGAGILVAGGGLTATRTFVIGKGQTQTVSPVGSSIALDDSVASVWARNSVQVDAIYNPTSLTQTNARSDSTLGGGFLTYGLSDGNTSAVNLSSTTGSVTVDIFPTAGPMGTLLGTTQVALNGPTLSILPPTLMVQALQGDIVVNGYAGLAPAPQAQLSLFAAGDIAAASAGSSPGFQLSDSFLSSIATAADPELTGRVVAPFQGAIHTGDPNPALITAGNDIDGLTLSIPKAAQVVAGRDLINVTYSGQNTSAGDTTLISAGRDLVDTGTGDGIQVSGPGSVDVLTGRNLNLGLGNGIVTLGNLNNPNLPTAQGADLTLMVGYGTQGADLPGFLKTIIAPSTTYQSELVSYVESLNGDSGLTYAQAAADFTSLSASQQTPLIDGMFFNELLLSGRAANSGTGVGFTEGYAAIDALFPGSRSTSGTSHYSGNLSLTSSRIYTDSGGDISILVPGGQIDVGLANPPATLQAKPASDLGIVAEGTGNVSIYSLNDVNVNKSRVFTLGGGNILIWSDLGSIDAGNGSKSSLSVPPPIVNISQAGVVTLDFGGALASGSGIRTIQTSPEVPPGNVDLDAPVGTVNAGDAGIGASGNINIAAAHVIGVDNINFGGTATGVPSDLSGLSASLSGVAAVAAGATTSATSSATEAAASKETAPLAQTALSWLDVFVTGLGEENCKQDDVECLKRQRAAAP